MIFIRKTIPADAENLATCIDSVARERLYLAITEGFSKESTELFIKQVHSIGGIHIVAIDKTIVGWCDITPINNEGMTHVGRLGMGVIKTHRKQGIGKSMLQNAIKNAFKKNMNKIEIEVFSSNSVAISFYENLGFKLEGTRVGSRKLDGVLDNICLYALFAARV